MSEIPFKKIGVFKCGNIAVSPLFELLLDELADRQDVKTRTVTTGSKMLVEDVEEALPKLFEFDPDLIALICPNPSILGPNCIRDKSEFQNPYAKAKAIAAYELTEKIAEINTQACFVEKESEKFIPLVASAHEIAQIAAKLAEEAREIEKYNDNLVRKPHGRDGRPKIKTKLMFSPTLDEEFWKEEEAQG